MTKQDCGQALNDIAPKGNDYDKTGTRQSTKTSSALTSSSSSPMILRVAKYLTVFCCCCCVFLDPSTTTLTKSTPRSFLIPSTSSSTLSRGSENEIMSVSTVAVTGSAATTMVMMMTIWVMMGTTQRTRISGSVLQLMGGSKSFFGIVSVAAATEQPGTGLNGFTPQQLLGGLRNQNPLALVSNLDETSSTKGKIRKSKKKSTKRKAGIKKRLRKQKKLHGGAFGAGALIKQQQQKTNYLLQHPTINNNKVVHDDEEEEEEDDDEDDHHHEHDEDDDDDEGEEDDHDHSDDIIHENDHADNEAYDDIVWYDGPHRDDEDEHGNEHHSDHHDDEHENDSHGIPPTKLKTIQKVIEVKDQSLEIVLDKNQDLRVNLDRMAGSPETLHQKIVKKSDIFDGRQLSLTEDPNGIDSIGVNEGAKPDINQHDHGGQDGHGSAGGSLTFHHSGSEDLRNMNPQEFCLRLKHECESTCREFVKGVQEMDITCEAGSLGELLFWGRCCQIGQMRREQRLREQQKHEMVQNYHSLKQKHEEQQILLAKQIEETAAAAAMVAGTKR